VATVPGSGYGNFDVSSTGTLISLGEPAHDGRRLVFVDRAGAETPLPDAPRHFVQPRVSPDGQRLAVGVIGDDREDIWVRNFQNDTFERVTLDGFNGAPLWSRDGRTLTFSSRRGREHQIVSQPADRSRPPVPLISSRNNLFAATWAADERTLLYVDSPPTDIRIIKTITEADRGQGRSLDTIPVDVDWPAVSPDGRWLAFVSYETGRGEI